METYIWNGAIVLSKLFFYLGFVLAAGYTFFAYGQGFPSSSDIKKGITDFSKLTMSFVAIALMANIAYFFAITGLMAEDGLRGAFSPNIIGLIWSTAIGDNALLRGIGLSTVILIVLISAAFQLSTLLRRGMQLLMFLAVLLLAYSFVQLGHISEIGLIGQIVLVFHVLVMAWWFGALYPLKVACLSFSDEELIKIMRSFSKQAVIMVFLSLAAGVLLAIELIDSVYALFNTSYGLTLLLKLSLVVSILGIAARNKLKLVPAIRENAGRKLLSKSITNEMMVAVAILGITAGLTTVVGPTA